jgi:uncharacterized RDD family membrane protein YckC
MAEKSLTQYELGDTGARLVAIIIDGFVIGLIFGLLSIGAQDSFLGSIVSFIVGLGYNWYFWTKQNGQTPGKRLMNLRVIDAKTGGSLNDTQAAIRYVGYYINSMAAMIGWLWAFFDKDRRGWHDMIAGTLVVKA